VHAAPPGKANFTDEGWPFQTPVIVSAVRCTLRDVFLPFAVPLIGIASGAALSILLVLDVIAAIAIITTLRRLWRVQHASRWQYLLLAMGLALLLGVFFVTDITVIGV
jgi:ABC-type iron transport system FetAB permease component